jgi:hypothetical protein
MLPPVEQGHHRTANGRQVASELVDTRVRVSAISQPPTPYIPPPIRAARPRDAGGRR